MDGVQPVASSQCECVARFVRDKNPDVDVEGLSAAVLQTFGRKRRTSAISAHLRGAMKRLSNDG